MIVEHNNYSDKLKAYLEEHRPKPGEKVIFQAIGKKLNTNNGKLSVLPEVSILAHDSIFDEGKNAFIKIANITATIPVSDPDSKKEFRVIYTKPSFTRENWSEIKLRGDNPEDIALFDYLFLCRWFDGNKGRKGYEKAPMSGYQFIMLNPDKDAKNALEKDKAVRRAKDYIDAMKTPADLRSLARALGHVNADSKDYTDSQIVTFLYKKATEDPAKIEFTAKSAKTAGLDMAADLFKAGIIAIEGNGKDRKVINVETKETICAVAKGTPEEAFYEYLNAQEKDVKEAYMNMLLSK